MRRVFLALVLLCVTPAFSADRALTTGELTMQPPCVALDSGNPENDPVIAERIDIVRYACRLPVDDVTAAQAEAALGEQNLAVVRDGDTLTMFARAEDDAPRTLSGSLRGPLEHIGDTPFLAARLRLAELDHALLWIFVLGGSADGGDAPSVRWRGPHAPPAPAFQHDISGQVIERTLFSEALGETRRLAFYLPPSHRSGHDYPTVFLADGGEGAIQYYARILEPLIVSDALPPLVLVGAESGQPGIVEDRSALGSDIRALDYLPGYEGNTERFPAHMIFFSEELVAYAVREFSVTTDASRRVVAGQSNGGTFAFWAAYQRPEVFGNAIVSSQAWRPVEDLTPTTVRARFFMNAGLYEQPFLRTTRRTAAALRAQGYAVTLDEMAAGHVSDQTEVMLIDRLHRIFSPAPNSPPDR